MDEELLQRIDQIHAAVGAVEETDSKKLRATVIATDKIKAVFQDFRGTLTQAQLANCVSSVIQNIASLGNHLRRWAAHNGKNKKKVDEVIGQSLELQIIEDLWNNDKHGYPRRNAGGSGKSPKLVQINRVMRLTTRDEAGSTIAMTLGADGTPRFFGDGNARAIITGDVLDKHDNRIGDLYEIATKAVEAWERLLNEFNVPSNTDDT